MTFQLAIQLAPWILLVIALVVIALQRFFAKRTEDGKYLEEMRSAKRQMKEERSRHETVVMELSRELNHKEKQLQEIKAAIRTDIEKAKNLISGDVDMSGI